MSAPSAAWPTPALFGAAARAQWGDLDGRAHAGERAILRALVDLLPYGSGTGHVTAAQVAHTAGYSERWTRHCLAALEAAGLITWSRGWLDRGTPRPGVVRIVKTALAALIRAARRDGKAERRAITARASLAGRLDKLRRPTQRHHPKSHRAELTASPSLRREEPRPHRGPVAPQTKPPGATMQPPAPYQCAICRLVKRECQQLTINPHPYTPIADAPHCETCHRSAAHHAAMDALVAPEHTHPYAPSTTRKIRP